MTIGELFQHHKSFRSEVIELLPGLKEQIMALPTIQDLDAALASVTTAVNQLGTDLTAAIAALEAKIAAAGTPIDLTSEIAGLKAVATQATTLDAATVAANPPAAKP